MLRGETRGEEVDMSKFAIAVVAVSLLALLAAPAVAQDTRYLELVQPGRSFDPTWPVDGSGWHELYPVYCTGHVQTGHDDANGNGTIEACENITLDGVLFHIDWIGPTYVLRQPGRDLTKYVEATLGRQGHNYHEVYPTFCKEITTEEPIEFVCQDVFITNPPEDMGWWHVEYVGTNIITSPSTPVDQSTWSRIKAFIGGLFD